MAVAAKGAAVRAAAVRAAAVRAAAPKAGAARAGIRNLLLQRLPFGNVVDAINRARFELLLELSELLEELRALRLPEF